MCPIMGFGAYRKVEVIANPRLTKKKLDLNRVKSDIKNKNSTFSHLNPL
jgi:hypothetical protein